MECDKCKQEVEVEMVKQMQEAEKDLKRYTGKEIKLPRWCESCTDYQLGEIELQ